MSAENAEE